MNTGEFEKTQTRPMVAGGGIGQIPTQLQSKYARSCWLIKHTLALLGNDFPLMVGVRFGVRAVRFHKTPWLPADPITNQSAFSNPQS